MTQIGHVQVISHLMSYWKFTGDTNDLDLTSYRTSDTNDLDMTSHRTFTGDTNDLDMTSHRTFTIDLDLST